MKRLLLSVAAAAMLATSAVADYTFVVPQRAGQGTTVWAEIIAKELEPFLGESITIKMLPGARDIPGFNEWHNEMRDDDKTVMVSHGGNGVSFLQENVDYDYEVSSTLNYNKNTFYKMTTMSSCDGYFDYYFKLKDHSNSDSIIFFN